MYSSGDQIIHPRYGAGIIVGKKKLTFKGKTRSYHVVELVGNRGEVMIPVETATDMNIRPAIEDLTIIEEVFALPPAQLSDDYRSRQAKIQKQIQTREPHAMAEALRDLYWREQNDKLTSVELKMKSSLIKMLSHEIAVICAEKTVEKANSQLMGMLHRMIQRDEPESDDPDSARPDRPSVSRFQPEAAKASSVAYDQPLLRFCVIGGLPHSRRLPGLASAYAGESRRQIESPQTRSRLDARGHALRQANVYAAQAAGDVQLAKGAGRDLHLGDADAAAQFCSQRISRRRQPQRRLAHTRLHAQRFDLQAAQVDIRLAHASGDAQANGQISRQGNVPAQILRLARQRAEFACDAAALPQRYDALGAAANIEFILADVRELGFKQIRRARRKRPNAGPAHGKGNLDPRGRSALSSASLKDAFLVSAAPPVASLANCPARARKCSKSSDHSTFLRSRLMRFGSSTCPLLQYTHPRVFLSHKQ